MNIKPLFDKVVIESVPVEEKTKSGLFLTAASQEKPQSYLRRYHRRQRNSNASKSGRQGALLAVCRLGI